MFRILLISIIGSLLVFNAVAFQISATSRVYQSQYINLRMKAVSLMERARESQGNSSELQEERLALAKLVHRLQEEAMQDNGQLLARGQPSDKSLLLVSQACAALDFTLLSVDSYIETGDRSFLQLAREGVALMDSIEKFF